MIWQILKDYPEVWPAAITFTLVIIIAHFIAMRLEISEPWVLIIFMTVWAVAFNLLVGKDLTFYLLVVPPTFAARFVRKFGEGSQNVLFKSLAFLSRAYLAWLIFFSQPDPVELLTYFVIYVVTELLLNFI